MIGLAYAAGVGLSVLAATAFAVQYIAVRIGARNGSVTDVVFVSLVCNVLLIVPPVIVLYEFTRVVTYTSLVAFALAGIAGSLLARLFMYQSIERIGASRTSPVVATNVFFATILAVFILGERLEVLHGIGIVLIVAGVAVISREMAQEPTTSLRRVGAVLILPFAAAVFLGMEPIFISIGLADGTPVLPGFAIKATTATVGFGAYLYLRDSLPDRQVISTPGFRWYLGAGISSTVGIGAYITALTVAPVVVVIPLLQTVPLIVLLFSVIFLPRHLELVTIRLWIGAMVVVGGTIIVSIV